MKKRKLKCPYFILLVLTSALFGCIYIIKGNIFDTFITGESNRSRDIASISGNSVLGNATGGQQSVSDNNVSGVSVSQNSSEKIVLDTEVAVKKYLSGTLFIGDSRTVTIKEYAGWEEAHFFVKNGLTVWDVLEEKIAEYNGEQITVDEALQKQKFERIYIMLGINELGRGTPETFAEKYRQVVERIKQLQPDAVIIVEAIMHVTKEKDEEQTYINNAEINARNEKIREMAGYAGVSWLDVNQVMDDAESHCLVSEYSFDGVHLKVKYLDIWKEFLLENPF